MAPVALIALDLGGVLLQTHKSRLYEAIARSPQDIDAAFFEKIRFLAFELGHIQEEAYFAHIARKLKISSSTAKNAFHAIIELRRDWLEVIESLGAPFCLWSNINRFHYETTLCKAPALAKNRSWHALSFELHTKKPQPRFYRLALSKIDCAAERVLFVDDQPQNLAQAKRLGVMTYLSSMPKGSDCKPAS